MTPATSAARAELARLYAAPSLDAADLARLPVLAATLGAAAGAGCCAWRGGARAAGGLAGGVGVGAGRFDCDWEREGRMSRVIKERSDLVVISRDILQDEHLSWSARGVAAFLLSGGIAELTDGCAEIDELIEAGYIDVDPLGVGTLHDRTRDALLGRADIQPDRTDSIRLDESGISPRRSFRRRESKRILERDFYRCRYCNSHIDLAIDHVIPVIQGGDNSESNLVACCRQCNSRKGGRTPEQAGMVLLMGTRE